MGWQHVSLGIGEKFDPRVKVELNQWGFFEGYWRDEDISPG